MQGDSIVLIAKDTCTLVRDGVATGAQAIHAAHHRSCRAALSRLGELLQLELDHQQEFDALVLLLIARSVYETWLVAHARLHLGDRADHYSLSELDRQLDLTVYGMVNPPKAFQRHAASFRDEIDIRIVNPFSDIPLTTPPVSNTDVLRVSLWVVLFLAHDVFAAIGQPEDAQSAFALFKRLRTLTDEFYAQRQVSSR